MMKRPTQPSSRIAKMRLAAASKKPVLVDTSRVDSRVASLVVQTYEALSPKNRKAFAQMPAAQMIATAMKLRKAAVSSKSAKVQKKADAGNGVVYFGISMPEYQIEADMNSEDPEDRERFEDFMRGHEDETDAALAAESAMLKQMVALFKKALGRDVTINNEGHDNYGDLVCKVSVNSLDEVRKVKDMVDRKSGSEGTIDSDNDSYTSATGFQFVSWGDSKRPEQTVAFEDLDEWLEDQVQATTAKAKRTSKTKRKAGPGAGRTFLFSGRSRRFRASKPSFGSTQLTGDQLGHMMFQALKNRSVDLHTDISVHDLSVESYYNVAHAEEAGTIDVVSIPAQDLKDFAIEIVKSHGLDLNTVIEQELAEIFEDGGEFSPSTVYNNIVYGFGWSIPAPPSSIDIEDGAGAEGDLVFKSIRRSLVVSFTGSMTLSDEMRDAFAELEYLDMPEDDDEDADFHEARTRAASKRSVNVKKASSISWHDRGKGVYTADVVVRSKYNDKPIDVVLRIDGRDDQFRVDKGGMGGWEAIDGGAHMAPKSLEEAKAFAETWLAEANKQGSLTPRINRSAKVKKKASPVDYDKIVEEYAKALFATTFASACDEAVDDGTFARSPWRGGDNIYDYLPDMPAAYLNLVEQFLGSLKPAKGSDNPGGKAGIEQDFVAYNEATGNNEEKYGYQLSMQHQGTGVSTSDDGHFDTAFGGMYPVEGAHGYIEVTEDEDGDKKVEFFFNPYIKGSSDFTLDITDDFKFCLPK